MGSLHGTFGLITGVANKRWIAWAIAKAMARDGARLALTYQGERLLENVQEPAAELARPLLLACDVTSDIQIGEVFEAIARAFGGLDFMLHGTAFASREELSRPFVETSREGFRVALDISAFSLIALSRGAAPLMAARGGGTIVTLTYLGADRVFTNFEPPGGCVRHVCQQPFGDWKYLENHEEVSMNFKRLFQPTTMAVVGVSLSNDRHPANVIYQKNNLRQRVKVFPVNGRGGDLQGETVFPRISDIPEKIDLAVLGARAEFMPDLLAGCIQAEVGGAIVISGGFAESGRKDLQDMMIAAAKEAGFPFIGPNCLGIYSPPFVDTFFLPSERLVRPERGKVAMVSQIGGFLVDQMAE